MSLRVWDDGPHFKESRTQRLKAKLKTRTSRRRDEQDEKAKVRLRDGYRCRFPLCGCKKLALPLEVSHQTQHKGMGGNPAGDRSKAKDMALLCNHRHQYGRVSRHAGTLRGIPISLEKGYNGPVIWQVHHEALPDGQGWHAQVIRGNDGWLTVAVEFAPGQIAELYPWQRQLLAQLAEMDL